MGKHITIFLLYILDHAEFLFYKQHYLNGKSVEDELIGSLNEVKARNARLKTLVTSQKCCILLARRMNRIFAKIISQLSQVINFQDFFKIFNGFVFLLMSSIFY